MDLSRSGSAASRFMLLSRVFCNVPSPLGSRLPDFLSTLLTCTGRSNPLLNRYLIIMHVCPYSAVMGHEVQSKKCQIMSIASGKSHPTYLYNLCGHVLSCVQIAKYLGITLQMSCHGPLMYTRSTAVQTPPWAS